MSRRVSGILKFMAFMFVAATILAGPALAGKIESFTAEHVTIGPDGKIISKGIYYASPNAMRMEQPSPMGGGKFTVIVLKDEKKMYTINPAKKLYAVTPMDDKMMQPGGPGVEIKSEKVLGKEKVAGYKCVKKEVVQVMDMMGQKKEMKIIQWQADEFEMPLRTKVRRGHIQEFRNIKPGKVDKKHFEPPKGYKKVANMMQLFMDQ